MKKVKLDEGIVNKKSVDDIDADFEQPHDTQSEQHVSISAEQINAIHSVSIVSNIQMVDKSIIELVYKQSDDNVKADFSGSALPKLEQTKNEEPNEVIAQLIQEGQPMKLTNLFVDRPITIMLVQIIILLLIQLICFQLGYFSFTDSHLRDYLVWDTEMTRTYDMNLAAIELMLTSKGQQQQPVRIQETKRWDTIILYKTPSEKENLLSKYYLKKIKDIEDQIKGNEQWKNLCRAQSSSDQTCHRRNSLISPITYLEGINKDLKFDLATFDQGINKYEGDWTILSQEQLDTIWQGFFDSQIFSEYSFLYNSFENDAGRSEIQFMRSAVLFGAPLDIDGVRYNDITNQYQNQTQLVVKFQNEIAEYLVEQEEKDEKKGNNVLTAISFSEEYALQQFMDIAEHDTSFAGISVTFVIFYFIIHLKSYFLALMGAFMISCSFGVTAILFRGIFQIHFYQNLHGMVIFLVLGISADDIFVIIDAWRQSAYIEQFNGSLHHRMSYTWKRAMRAMAVTSSTTAVAFLANVFSPLMPIKSFGIYSAIIILVNYLQVVVFFPSVIIIYERYFDKYAFCCCLCGKLKKEFVEKQKQREEALKLAKAGDSEQTAGSKQPVMQNTQNKEQAAQGQQVVVMGKVEQFFGGTWNKWIHKLRFLILFVLGIWISVGIYYAQQIGPITKMEDWYPPEHRQSVFRYAQRDHFYSSNVNINERNALKVQVFWGVNDIDQTQSGIWNSSDLGKIKMDEKFSLSSIEEQKNILDFCEDLKLQDFVVNQQVQCWLKDSFDTWLRGPTQEAKLKMMQNPAYQMTLSDLNGKGLHLPLEPEKFDELLLQFANSDDGSKLQSDSIIGFLDDKLVFFQIIAVTTVQPYDTEEVKKPIYDKWEQYLSEYRSTTLDSLKSVKQTANIFWSWMDTEKTFGTSAISGIQIAMGFAFFILLVATKNIILALLAITCVSMVVVSVLAVMVLMGWELGISESLSVVILIGLAVDYVVHLAQDYIHSAQTTRYDKIRQAYTEMGVTILSGTITTLGCGSALFGGQMMTFKKFAVMITSTIMFSFMSAMILFGALCHIFGPEKKYGNIDCCKKKQQ